MTTAYAVYAVEAAAAADYKKVYLAVGGDKVARQALADRYSPDAVADLAGLNALGVQLFEAMGTTGRDADAQRLAQIETGFDIFGDPIM